MASSAIISMNAGRTSFKEKKRRIQVMFRTAFATNSPMIRLKSLVFLLKIHRHLSSKSLLFQTISADIVVIMKIIFHAIGNIKFGGVSAGCMSMLLYQFMPSFVSKLPTMARHIVIDGMIT